MAGGVGGGGMYLCIHSRFIVPEKPPGGHGDVLCWRDFYVQYTKGEKQDPDGNS